MSLGALGQYGSDSSISDSDSDQEDNKCSEEGVNKNTSAHCMDPLRLCGEQEESDSASDASSHSSPLPPLSPASLLPLPDIESIVAKNASYSGSELHTSALSCRKELRGQHDGGKDENKSSVFSNPYEQAEEAKMAMLKKHVPEFDKKPETRGPSPPPSHRRYKKKRVGGNSLASTEAERSELFDENDSSLAAKKDRKHRSGVTDSLQPPKKFMKMYDKIYPK